MEGIVLFQSRFVMAASPFPKCIQLSAAILRAVP
jgi:hypothetical protein